MASAGSCSPYEDSTRRDTAFFIFRFSHSHGARKARDRGMNPSYLAALSLGGSLARDRESFELRRQRPHNAQGRRGSPSRL